MIRIMLLSEVIGAMENAVAKNRDQRQLLIYANDCEINYGPSQENPRYLPGKIISVSDRSSGNDVFSVVVRVNPDSSLSFDSADDSIGMMLYDCNGNPTPKPKDRIALEIAACFVDIIGKRYFYNG